MTIAGRPLEHCLAQHPLLADVISCREVTWFNPGFAPAATALADVGLTAADVAAADARLRRFAPFLARAFPETSSSGGLIESPLTATPRLQAALAVREGRPHEGSLYVKRDSELPISGSIKARGGIYEVLTWAEKLALAAGLIGPGADYATLAGPAGRALFARHRVVAGSTGNLGLSIGIIGAALGLKVTIHMSADARAWKKDRLRSLGVDVVEHGGDYGAAVAAGRREAEVDPASHFVDDESSTTLFLGYAVAARRLERQLADADVIVDAEHPLFVHLPCGVGGGPGGVAFGLKLVYGDAVHCLFAEPTHAPAMLLGLMTGLHDQVAAGDFGIDGVTAADGLAVGRPSRFVGQALRRLVDACYTVDDLRLFAELALAADCEDLRLEPSALAGVSGMARVLARQAAPWRQQLGLTDERMAQATHIAWATGGSMVPDDEIEAYRQRGRLELGRPTSQPRP